MAEKDYGWASRLLHRLALAWPAVAKASLELETIACRGSEGPQGPHVFVSGLARSGSTVLLEALYSTDLFRSLTYRDMPFVLMPGMWSRLSASSRREQAKHERAHGDRVMVNADSPEAFEEVFWRVHCGRDYIMPDRLKKHRADTEVIEKFRVYVDRILASDPHGRCHYLSKNNNNILRIDSIRTAFPEAIILVPYRDPQQQAMSLHAQHTLFTRQQGEDAFTRRYMQWLGHHEFGLAHLPFDLKSDGQHSPPPQSSGEGLGEGQCQRFAADDPNYWLDEWSTVYEALLETAADKVTFLSYEALCNDPQATLAPVFKDGRFTGIDAAFAYPLEVAAPKEFDNWNADAVQRAAAIHSALLNLR